MDRSFSLFLSYTRTRSSRTAEIHDDHELDVHLIITWACFMIFTDTH
jgi:hypothetical protein